jgi:hypothetical protein
MTGSPNARGGQIHVGIGFIRTERGLRGRVVFKRLPMFLGSPDSRTARASECLLNLARCKKLFGAPGEPIGVTFSVFVSWNFFDRLFTSPSFEGIILRYPHKSPPH